MYKKIENNNLTEENYTLYENRLRDLIDSCDVESAHGEADDILCEILDDLGLSDIVALYKSIEKWYA